MGSIDIRRHCSTILWVLTPEIAADLQARAPVFALTWSLSPSQLPMDELKLPFNQKLVAFRRPGQAILL